MNSDRGDKRPSRQTGEERKSFGDAPLRKPRENTATEIDDSERIAKRLARAGIASRRDAEMMISSGRIAVNGVVLSSPAFNVTRSDAITVDGKPLPPIERTRLWLYHKQSGLVTTNRDPEGRPTVFDSLPEGMPRVLSVGRLDINTEGLLLLTNDGGLARVLELPSTGWVRKYRVRAHGKVKQSDLDQLKNGIAIDGIFYGAVEASIEREQGSNVWLSVALREGKNREVKNILGALGLSVTRLIRISFGPFQLSDLEEGAVRELKGRTLREQLGERLIEEANADFDAPILKPFSNAPVVADTRLVERPVVSEDGWISSTAQSSGGSRNSGGRGKKGDFAERGRARMSTRPSDGPKGKFKADGRGSSKGGAKEEEETAERPAPRSRGANVWMAPGARPQTASKKYRPASDRPREEGTYGDRKRQDSREGSYEKRERKPYGDKPKSYGERSESGDRKPYRPREEGAYGDRKRQDSREGSYEKRERKPYGDKPKSYGERSESGDRKPYRPREEGAYGDRKRQDSREGSYEKRERKPYGDKPKSYGERSESGDRKPYRPREEGTYGDRKRQDSREGSYEKRERKPYDDKPKSYGERSESGDRKPYRPREEGAYGDRKRQDSREGSYEKRERKPYGDKPKSYGERSEGGDRKPYRPREERTYGERKTDNNRGGSYGKRDGSSSDARAPRKEGSYAKKDGAFSKRDGASRSADEMRKSKPAGGPRADRRR